MTSNITRHSLITRLAACALFTVLFSAAVFAQPAAAQQHGTTPKANLIIEQKAVRFDLQGSARSWQIEVFNQPGDLIFASGVVSQPTVEWALTDQQEKPLSDGLYVYSLKFWDENNQQLSIQRGHVIVNRASSSDRIWVTSNNSTGVGSASELTVVGSPDSTVGGARLLETRASASARSTGDSTNAQQIKDNGIINAVGNISGDGTAGRIAKFTGAHTIDDSVMSESGGKISVGTTATSIGKLYVVESIGSNNASVYGRNLSGANPSYINTVGVIGESLGTGSTGVKGTGQTGVYGGGVTGVRGESNLGSGVWGSSEGASGVRGTTEGDSSDAGVRGEGNSANSNGVIGEATGGYGVWGTSETSIGVRGQSTSSSGVSGYSLTGRGVYGDSNSHHGVYGRSQSPDHAGVYGYTTNVNGVGVEGVAPGGSNQTSIGVYGIGSGWGVVGVADAGHGVAGYGSFLGASIYGANGAAWAGYFNGNVEITGTLNANNLTGNFASKIDHPLDPANKYLNQTFVESPEMMSVQNGNITTDANGEAVVTLPEYFQAMSGDFRYQLTVVGQFAQAIVAQKIEGNRFTIKTDKPNVEVSWQVTGLRQDAAAKASRKPAEELKPEAERGYYLRPAAFGQPEEKSIEWARNPEMMKRMKAEPEPRREAKSKQ